MPDLKSPEEVAREIAAPETCPCCEEMIECRTGCTFKTDCPDEYDRLEYDRDRCRAVARAIRERDSEILKHLAALRVGQTNELSDFWRGVHAYRIAIRSLLAPKESDHA